MKKFGKIIIGLVLLISLALVLSYCGSKSSDSGTTSTTTTTNTTASAGAGASVSTTAISSATMALSSTAGSTAAPSFKKSKNLSAAFNGFYSGLRAKRAETNALKAKSMMAPAVTTCPVSGTMTMMTTTNISTAGTTTTMTTAYDNCISTSGTTTTVMNGTLVFTDSGTSFTFSMGTSTTPYTVKTTLKSTGAVILDNATNLTFTGVSVLASAQTCTPQIGNPVTEYTDMTITMDGNMHAKGIDEHLIAYDETTVVTAFKLDSTNTLVFSATCAVDITGGTTMESGKISYTDNLDSSANESMDISASNPITLTWTKVTTAPTGDTYRISGTVSAVTACFTGTLTLVTTTDMFVPTNSDCPTAGVVTVSGSVSGTVIYTSTGGVQVKDGSGTIVATYASCNDAEACISR